MPTPSKKRQPAATPENAGASGGELIGYGRVSKDDQRLELQLDALNRAGCSQIYMEKESRALKASERAELTNALKALRKGDTLIVWKLDRLGGNLVDLVTLVDGLKERGIHFQSLTENIDTKNSTDRMFFHVVAVFAEFERNRISERTKAGLAAARARGRKGGRPLALTAKQVREINALLSDRTIPVTDICKRYNIARATFYKHFPNAAAQPPASPAGKDAI